MMNFVPMLRTRLRRALATVMMLVLAFAATAVCIAGAGSQEKATACMGSMDEHHTADRAIAADCCVVEPPSSNPPVAGALQASVATACPIVTRTVQIEPLLRPQFASAHARDLGPRHNSAYRSHLFDSLFRI